MFTIEIEDGREAPKSGMFRNAYKTISGINTKGNGTKNDDDDRLTGN